MKVEDDCGDAMCYKRDIYCIYIIHLYMCFLFLKNCGSSEHLRLKPTSFNCIWRDVAWQLPHLSWFPYKKVQNAHPSSKPCFNAFQWWVCWLWKLKVYVPRKTENCISLNKHLPEMLFPSLGSSLPVHGKRYVVKLPGNRTLPENLGRKLRIRKSRVKFKNLREPSRNTKGLDSASARHQSMMDPWGLNPWVVKPVGQRSNYEWSVISPI